MTLIISGLNLQYAIQVSDRRLSANGATLTDESNKATIFACDSGRFIVGFTGLATIGPFRTQRWILNTLSACAAPDYWAPAIFERFRQQASKDFATAPFIRALGGNQRRLTIMLSGFLVSPQGTLPVLQFITNFQNFDSGYDDDAAWPEFREWHFILRTDIDDAADVQRIGNRAGLPLSDVFAVKALLAQRKTPNAVIGKMAAAIRRAADHPASGGTVGKQLMSVILPADFTQAAQGGYDSAVAGHVVFMPDMVAASRTGGRVVMREFEFKAVDPSSAPLIVPRQNRRALCSCGSGKRYKNCHGRFNS